MKEQQQPTRRTMRSAWICSSIGDGGSRCNAWGMTTERRCAKCGAPRAFKAHDLMVGQARHVRCCEGRSRRHTTKRNRWAPASGECSLRVYDAASASPTAITRLRDRFDLMSGAQDDDVGYIHLEWQDRPQAEHIDRAVATDSPPAVAEMVIRASSVEAQVVHMRQPQLLADGAGKVELLLELSSMPSTSHDTIAAQLAKHHHPTHEHGLFSVIVCFEALAALAPLLRLDSKDHPPNHNRLEPWLVHLPPRVYSCHTRSWIMWATHTLVPFATVLWGLWQLYFNVDVVQRAINDAFRMASECIERIVGPILGIVSLVLTELNAWLIEFTEQFNVWWRPLKMVLQPLVTAGLAAGQGLMAPVRGLAQVVQPVCWIVIKPLRALASCVQLVCSIAIQPLRWLAERSRPAWSFARYVGTKVATLLNAARGAVSRALEAASAIFGRVRGGLVEVVAAVSRATSWVKSSKLGETAHQIGSKLSLIMRFKPQTETKVMVAHMNKLAKNVQPVAMAASEMSGGIRSPRDHWRGRGESELPGAKRLEKQE